MVSAQWILGLRSTYEDLYLAHLGKRLGGPNSFESFDVMYTSLSSPDYTRPMMWMKPFFHLVAACDSVRKAAALAVLSRFCTTCLRKLHNVANDECPIGTNDTRMNIRLSYVLGDPRVVCLHERSHAHLYSSLALFSYTASAACMSPMTRRPLTGWEMLYIERAAFKAGSNSLAFRLFANIPPLSRAMAEYYSKRSAHPFAALISVACEMAGFQTPEHLHLMKSIGIGPNGKEFAQCSPLIQRGLEERSRSIERDRQLQESLVDYGVSVITRAHTTRTDETTDFSDFVSASSAVLSLMTQMKQSLDPSLYEEVQEGIAESLSRGEGLQGAFCLHRSVLRCVEETCADHGRDGSRV